MKINRISDALGFIGDDISREAIEEFDKKSVKIDSTVPEEKPRVIREEKSHKAPFVIALAGLCAAAAVAAPLVLRNVGNSSIISGAAASSDNSYTELVESALDLGKSIAANVVKLRVSMNGDEVSAVRDDENPNVRFFTVKFDKTFNNRFGIIAGTDGTFELFEGDSVSEEKIIENLPDDKFGFVWTFEDGGNQTKCSETSNTLLYHNISLVSEKDGLVTTQFWLAERSDIKDVLDMLSAQGGSIEIIDNGDWTYSAYISPYSSLPDDSGISVNVKEVKMTLTDDKQLSVRDDENPNVRIFTIDLDKSKAKVQAFVINKDGTYKTFAGDDISKEGILRECPDGVSGVMWSSDTNTESALFVGEGSNPAFNGTFEYKGGDLWSYEYWYSNDDEAKRACWDYGFDESGYPLRLKDNGDGTYTVYPDAP